MSRISQLQETKVAQPSWARYHNFWPPTVIEAMRDQSLVVFMGAGVSAAAGFPTWRDLLENRLGVPADFLADESLKTDNLTLGEIASRLVGREHLQDSLRNVYNSGKEPTLAHYALVALDLPNYITTNYDRLFEIAWHQIHGSEIAVICNSADATEHRGQARKLYKIHGSAERTGEMLVLTRSEYRQHYRANAEVFEEVRSMIRDKPTLFTGFSHTDPEIGRLIDDVIYSYEGELQKGGRPRSPDLYNMQFENTYVTNERFAAKGMVSLNVRLSEHIDCDPRTAGVAEALAELVDATATNIDHATSVDVELSRVVELVGADLKAAIDELSVVADSLIDKLCERPVDTQGLSTVLARIDLEKALATQGAYVLSRDGHLQCWRYNGQDKEARDAMIEDMGRNFHDRPYFQTANTFRTAFVSDFFESKFNGNATFAICVPLVRNNQFQGLLFSACQVGQWRTPIDASNKIPRDLGVFLLDAQGTVALPPHREFEVRVSATPKRESVLSRTGYDFLALKLLSRKDRVIIRLAENIVPVEKDDDVLSLDRKIDIYARIQNVGNLGWRCAISRTIKFTN